MKEPRWTQAVRTSLLLAALPLASSSCSSTAPEQAAPEVAPPKSAPEPERPRDDFWKNSDFMVRGQATDGNGVGVAAKVSLVDGNGSASTSTRNGQFELGGRGDFPHTLCAFTPDGRIGWRILDSAPASSPVTIEASKKGALLTLVPGDHNDRVSILVDGVPLYNVKFPSGESLTFVVPADEISFGTVGTSTHAADRRTLHLSAGSTTTVSF